MPCLPIRGAFLALCAPGTNVDFVGVQVASYAERKGIALAEAERWLAPVLSYDTA